MAETQAAEGHRAARRLAAAAARPLMAVLALAVMALGAVAGAPLIPGGAKQAVMAESAGTGNRAAAGYFHSLLVGSDGALWAWGGNGSGQLGLGDTTDRVIPARVGAAAGWASVAASWYNSFGVRSDGTLWAWGRNECGQLGVGYRNSRLTAPVRVGAASNWVAVSAGHCHTLGLRSDGTLWAWGWNAQGQLGLDGVALADNITSPARLGAGTDWVSIAAGDDHSLAVRSDGSLWAWGANSNGQLGLGDTHYRTAPARVAGDVQWAKVEAEYDYSLGIDRDGNLYSWGYNYRGLLGLGDAVSRKSPALVGGGWDGVYPGRTHCLGVRSDGGLYAWGSSFDGALGLGQGVSEATRPALVKGGAPAWAGGAAGDRFSIARRSDGTVWAFGWNGNGQLGLGDVDQRFVPVPVTLGWPLLVGTSNSSGVGDAGATLNGVLISMGDAASVRVSFQWGPTASYGNATAAQARTAAGAFSAGLTGLTAGTTYYYRATAEAAGETVYGEGRTFITATPAIPPVAPSVTTGTGGVPGISPEVETLDAEAVTAGSARLNGSLVSPGRAGSVELYFEWGTVPGSYPCGSAAIRQSGAGAFFLDVMGLAPDTTYYFRTRAVGEGSCLGGEKSFTTGPAPAGDSGVGGGPADAGTGQVPVAPGGGAGEMADGPGATADGGGPSGRGSAAAAAGVAVCAAALGLALGAGWWVTRKRSR